MMGQSGDPSIPVNLGPALIRGLEKFWLISDNGFPLISIIFLPRPHYIPIIDEDHICCIYFICFVSPIWIFSGIWPMFAFDFLSMWCPCPSVGLVYLNCVHVMPLAMWWPCPSVGLVHLNLVRVNLGHVMPLGMWCPCPSEPGPWEPCPCDVCPCDVGPRDGQSWPQLTTDRLQHLDK